MDELEDFKVQTAANYLERVGKLKTRVDALQAAVDELYTSAIKGTDYSKAVVTVSTTPDGVPNAVIKAQEAIARYAELQAEYVGAIDDAVQLIERLDDSLHVAILTRHYIKRETWEQVCVKEHYGYSRMMDFRREALAAFYDVMPDRGIPNATSE